MDEATTEPTPTPEPKDTPAKATTPDKPTRARKAKADTGLSEITDQDLVDPKTGRDAPLSAQTENLQATVAPHLGRALVRLATKGWIGEEPVVFLARDIGELQEIVTALEAALKAQRAAFAKAE